MEELERLRSANAAKMARLEATRRPTLMPASLLEAPARMTLDEEIGCRGTPSTGAALFKTTGSFGDDFPSSDWAESVEDLVPDASASPEPLRAVPPPGVPPSDSLATTLPARMLATTLKLPLRMLRSATPIQQLASVQQTLSETPVQQNSQASMQQNLSQNISQNLSTPAIRPTSNCNSNSSRSESSLSYESFSEESVLSGASPREGLNAGPHLEPSRRDGSEVDRNALEKTVPEMAIAPATEAEQRQGAQQQLRPDRTTGSGVEFRTSVHECVRDATTQTAVCAPPRGWPHGIAPPSWAEAAPPGIDAKASSEAAWPFGGGWPCGGSPYSITPLAAVPALAYVIPWPGQLQSCHAGSVPVAVPIGRTDWQASNTAQTNQGAQLPIAKVVGVRCRPCGHHGNGTHKAI
jgi:hypothetical protein